MNFYRGIGLEYNPNFKFLINMFRPQNHPCTAADFSNTGRGIMATEGLWSKKRNQTSPNRLRLQDSFLIFTIRTRPKTNLIDDRKFLFAHLYKLVWTGLYYKLDEVHKTKNEFLYLISLKAVKRFMTKFLTLGLKLKNSCSGFDNFILWIIESRQDI